MITSMISGQAPFTSAPKSYDGKQFIGDEVMEAKVEPKSGVNATSSRL